MALYRSGNEKEALQLASDIVGKYSEAKLPQNKAKLLGDTVDGFIR